MARVFLPEESFKNKGRCKHGHYKPDVGIDERTNTCWVCKLRITRESKARTRERLNQLPALQKPHNIKSTREYLGLSREAFSRVLGVHPVTVKGWETTRKIKSDTARKIAPKLAALVAYRREMIRVEHEKRADRMRHQNPSSQDPDDRAA